MDHHVHFGGGVEVRRGRGGEGRPVPLGEVAVAFGGAEEVDRFGVW